jgi:hypothetical protein
MRTVADMTQPRRLSSTEVDGAAAAVADDVAVAAAAIPPLLPPLIPSPSSSAGRGRELAARPPPTYILRVAIPEDGADGAVAEPAFENTVKSHSNVLGLMALIQGAHYRGVLCQPLLTTISHADVWDGRTGEFGVSGSRELSPKLVPSGFWFARPESGFHTMLDGHLQHCARAGRGPPAKDTLVWVGSGFTPFRQRIVRWAQAQNRTDLEFALITWSGADTATLTGSTAGYQSLAQLARHSTLIDLPGIGYSMRLPSLLATGRPVIAVDRVDEAWYFFEDLRPFEHYVPAADTEEGVAAAWEWVRANRAKAEEIGRRGQAWVLANLTRDHIHCRFATVLCGRDKDECLDGLRREAQVAAGCSSSAGAGWGGSWLRRSGLVGAGGNGEGDSGGLGGAGGGLVASLLGLLADDNLLPALLLLGFFIRITWWRRAGRGGKPAAAAASVGAAGATTGGVGGVPASSASSAAGGAAAGSSTGKGDRAEV